MFNSNTLILVLLTINSTLWSNSLYSFVVAVLWVWVVCKVDILEVDILEVDILGRTPTISCWLAYYSSRSLEFPVVCFTDGSWSFPDAIRGFIWTVIQEMVVKIYFSWFWWCNQSIIKMSGKTRLMESYFNLWNHNSASHFHWSSYKMPGKIRISLKQLLCTFLC